MNEDQALIIEEEDLKKEIAEWQAQLSTVLIEIQDKATILKAQKEEICGLNQRMQTSERELNLREIEYNQQKSTCKDLDKIAKKHSQKFQELEALQTNYNDLDVYCDELQKKLMIKSQEVKKLIHCGKEIIDKIKLGSSLTLEELPEISLVDFHKRNDIINKYKVRIFIDSNE